VSATVRHRDGCVGSKLYHVRAAYWKNRVSTIYRGDVIDMFSSLSFGQARSERWFSLDWPRCELQRRRRMLDARCDDQGHNDGPIPRFVELAYSDCCAVPSNDMSSASALPCHRIPFCVFGRQRMMLENMRSPGQSIDSNSMPIDWLRPESDHNLSADWQ
jgi:hypothetical protein